jgi:hypothetical protein
LTRPLEPQEPGLGWAYRAVRLYRAGSAVGAVVALLVANAIPLVGVALFGWSLWTILILYWLENGIVGVWNIPKIALAEGAPSGFTRAARLNGQLVASMSTAAQRAFTIPFFIFHYGLFWAVHGIFVFVLPMFLGFTSSFQSPVIFDPASPGPALPLEPPRSVGLGEIEIGPVVIGAIALFVSHGASFAWNYVARGEYRNVSPTGQMFAPYGRLFVLHLTIVLGAAGVAVLNSPLGLLVILVVGKTVLDLAFHLREHARASPPRDAQPTISAFDG